MGTYRTYSHLKKIKRQIYLTYIIYGWGKYFNRVTIKSVVAKLFFAAHKKFGEVVYVGTQQFKNCITINLPGTYVPEKKNRGFQSEEYRKYSRV